MSHFYFLLAQGISIKPAYMMLCAKKIAPLLKALMASRMSCIISLPYRDEKHAMIPHKVERVMDLIWEESE